MWGRCGGQAGQRVSLKGVGRARTLTGRKHTGGGEALPTPTDLMGLGVVTEHRASRCLARLSVRGPDSRAALITLSLGKPTKVSWRTEDRSLGERFFVFAQL